MIMYGVLLVAVMLATDSRHGNAKLMMSVCRRLLAAENIRYIETLLFCEKTKRKATIQCLLLLFGSALLMQ